VLPPWVDALRADDDLTAALGLVWHDAAEQERRRAEWQVAWSQVHYDDDFDRRCADRIARAVPLAGGPVRTRRIGRVVTRMVLVFDPDDPEHLYVSLCDVLPAVLWARAGTTADEVRAALRGYLVDSPTPVAELPCTLRVVKRLAPELDHAMHRRIVEAHELWLDDAPWGSWYDDDPWPEESATPGMSLLHAMLERTLRDHGGRFPAVSYRSLWSRSVLRVERHPFDLWVFELRYAPARDAAAMIRINELLGARFPVDLPVDLMASLLRDDSLTRLELDEALTRGPWLPLDLAMLSALEPGEATTLEALRRGFDQLAGDIDRVWALAEIAVQYRYEALLFELAATTTDPELRASLDAFLVRLTTNPAGAPAAQP